MAPGCGKTCTPEFGSGEFDTVREVPLQGSYQRALMLVFASEARFTDSGAVEGFQIRAKEPS